MPPPQIDAEFGNAARADTQGTGWFIGFSDWAKSGGVDLRFMPAEALSSGLCVKWYEHPPGHPNGDTKPLSEGRTISMLVGPPGEFRIECSLDASFPPEQTLSAVLREPGDYMVWGAGIHHRAFGLQRSTILTIRWTPATR